MTNGHSATGTQAHFNNFVSNPNGFVWDGTAAVNAENNWWGCNFGPGTGGVGCSGTPNGVGGTGAANVDANPWLTLSLMAMPAKDHKARQMWIPRVKKNLCRILSPSPA